MRRLGRLLLLAALLAAHSAAAAMELTLPSGTGSFRFEADHLTGSSEGDVTAEGDVKVIWREMTLRADRVAYRRAEQSVRAEGSVLLTDDVGNRMSADSVVLDAGNLKGEVTHGELTLAESGYSIRAERFERTGPVNYRAEKAVFTACDGTWPSWLVEADWLDVEIEGYLYGGGAVLKVESLPVAYLPFFFYPVKLKRQSGFLSPKVGYSDLGGYRLGTRYYWVVNESVDATLGVKYESRRGWSEGVKLRYMLGELNGGELEVNHLANRIEGGEQFDFRADHQGRITENTLIDLRGEYTTDEEDRRRYGDSFDARGVGLLESRLYAAHGTSQGTWYGLARYTQTLAEEQDEVLQQLPALGFIGAESPLWGRLRWRLDGDAVNFWREEGERGQRLRLVPSLSLDGEVGGLGLLIEGGYRQHYYDLKEEDDYGHGAGFSDVALRATLGRAYGDFVHLVEPRLAWRWEEFGRGGDPPEFDAEDRFEDRSEIALSLANRLLDIAEGREVAALDVERGLDLKKLDDEGWGGEPYGPWRGVASFEPWEGTGFRLDGEYDPSLSERKWLRWAADLHGADERGDKIFYRHQYLRDEADFFDAGVEIPLLPALTAGYRNRYSRRDEQSLEQSVTLLLEHPCWQLLGEYARVYIEDDDIYDNRYFVSVSLKGMNRLGKVSW